MAMKKMAGASKPAAKGKASRPQASAGKSNPKAATMKSRGSKTSTQVGNDNQRELYNAYRGSKNFVPGAARAKVTKTEAAKGGTKYGVSMATVRKTQRSGGKGK